MKKIMYIVIAVLFAFTITTNIKAQEYYESSSFHQIAYRDLANNYFSTMKSVISGTVTAMVGPCDSEWSYGPTASYSYIKIQINSGCHVHG